jgi:hypothetical protein
MEIPFFAVINTAIKTGLGHIFGNIRQGKTCNPICYTMKYFGVDILSGHIMSEAIPISILTGIGVADYAGQSMIADNFVLAPKDSPPAQIGGKESGAYGIWHPPENPAFSLFRKEEPV